MATAPARILWLIKGLGRGGAERLVALAAQRVDRTRFDVEVAYQLAHKDALAGELADAGVTVHALDQRRGGDPRWAARLARLVRTGGYDLVHSHSPVPAVVARAARRADTALVHTEHNTWDRFHPVTRVANAATFARNAHAFAVSEGVAASVHRPPGMSWAGWPPVEVAHHGIDEQAVCRGPVARKQARAELGLAEDDEVVGHVGTFTPKKDHAGLVEAVASLVPRRPRLRLVLFGLGPLEQAVRDQVDREGLDDHVRFLGVREDVQHLLPALDVFALPSRHEGLPIALVEAMAAERACVATRVGGIPEVVTGDHDGVLVPTGEPKAVAEAIEALLDDPPRRAALGAVAAATAQRFSITAAVRRQEQVYAELLGRDR